VGTSSSAGELAVKFGRFAASLETHRRDDIDALAFRAKKEFLKGPPRVGVRRGGSLRWSVNYKTGQISGQSAQALVRYRGNLHWIEGGTKRHGIAPKAVRGTRKTRSSKAMAGSVGKITKAGPKALAYNGKVRRFTVHPGAKKMPFFDRVKADTRKAVSEEMAGGLGLHFRRAGFTN